MLNKLLSKGLYYIGDLCYVFEKDRGSWEKLLDVTNNLTYNQAGVVNGVEFLAAPTAHGDGEYYSTQDVRFLVDSGSIGIVTLEGALSFGVTEEDLEFVGQIVEFSSYTWVKMYNGHFIFGEYVEIDTSYEYEFDDNDYDYHKDEDV